MAPARSFELSRRAAADLDDIYDFTVQRWSVTQAERYLLQLREAFEGLASGKSRGRDAELGRGWMKLTVNRHVVFFRETPHSVFIVRVLHAAMDAPRHLPG